MPGRVLLVALLSMLVVFFAPISAFADTINAEVISGPSEVPVLDMYGASIAAPDRYTAAALLMGYGPEAISGWGDDVKAKLSNEGTGGQFYVFANNSVQNYFDVTEHTGIFQDYFNFTGGAFWNVAQSLYGNNLWAALYYDGELVLAKADLERVLAGEDIGGGSTQDGEYFVYDFKSDDPAFSGVTSVYVPKSVFNFHGNKLNADTIKSGAVEFLSGSNGSLQGRIWFFSNSDNPEIYPNPNKNLYTSIIVTNATYWNQTNVVSFTPEIQGSALYLSSNSVIHVYDNSVKEGNYTCNLIIGSQTIANAVFSGQVGGGGGGDPVVPPTNWPEPETPEPPELPEPGDPVVEPPDPYEPSTGPTFIWNFTNTSEPTDTSNLLEWIKKIFYELKAIHSDLKIWFENLGTAITDGFEAMDNACGQIYDVITENTDELKNQFQALKTYLKQLFNWLGEKMNFQASGYDDTSVIYWLKRIWSKLGNGDINVRPTDPTTDPTGVWDWLIKLIQNFLIGLASSANDLISEMADLVSQVMHQFPFSIPWDIAAFLAAFAAAPITPDVDVTIPAIEGWWGETVISIDLSPYDTAAAAVRAMEKILFAAFLAWKSKDLLEFMDVTKWFNG